MKPFERAVALTGGIATGKSTAAAILSMLGFRIIDADTIAHRMLELHTPEIVREFGEGILDKTGAIERKRLGAIVFGDPEARARLEAILHPPIREEIERESLRQERLGKPYLIDIPLFYETGHYPIERVTVVYAPRQTQLERLIKRDGLSQEEALLRLEAQLDIETKRSRADWVINNSGDLRQLQRECERIREEILKAFS
ncbi:dephospho-CoA kinase [Nitratifractor sp.]